MITITLWHKTNVWLNDKFADLLAHWRRKKNGRRFAHYNDFIISAMASQITSLTIVYSTVYSGTDQRKHQSSASLAILMGILRWPINPPQKTPVTRKKLPFDDVIMQTKFLKAFSAIFIWSLFLKFQVTKSMRSFRPWHGAALATSHPRSPNINVLTSGLRSFMNFCGFVHVQRRFIPAAYGLSVGLVWNNMLMSLCDIR